MDQGKQKMKLLSLARLFLEETDNEHGLTMPQIISLLEERGCSAERKSIYRDIKALQDFGMDIRSYPRRPVEYALATRTFSQTQLLLLADAVQSSRFLTKSKSDELVHAIKTLGSRHQRQRLSRKVLVERRIKTQNESIFSNVDVIQDALRTKRKISFHYVKYDADKKQKLQHEGRPYLLTPVQLIYSDGFYYLITYAEKYDNFATYRVDRMKALMMTDEPAARNAAIANFDPSSYLDCAFGMYRGEKRVMTLLVREDAMSGVIDRFGKDVAVISTFSEANEIENETPDEPRKTAGDAPPSTPGKTAGGTSRHLSRETSDEATPKSAPSAKEPDASAKPVRWARVRANVMASPPLFGWLVQFGNAIRIEGPTDLAQAYQDHLRSILAAYDR